MGHAMAAGARLGSKSKKNAQSIGLKLDQPVRVGTRQMTFREALNLLDSLSPGCGSYQDEVVCSIEYTILDLEFQREEELKAAGGDVATHVKAANGKTGK